MRLALEHSPTENTYYKHFLEDFNTQVKNYIWSRNHICSHSRANSAVTILIENQSDHVKKDNDIAIEKSWLNFAWEASPSA